MFGFDKRDGERDETEDRSLWMRAWRRDFVVGGGDEGYTGEEYDDEGDYGDTAEAARARSLWEAELEAVWLAEANGIQVVALGEEEEPAAGLGLNPNRAERERG